MSKKKSKTNDYDVPETMKAWVLGDPHEMKLVEKTVPEPGSSEVLVKIGAIAVCHTDIEVLHHGHPAMIEGEIPFRKNFTPQSLPKIPAFFSKRQNPRWPRRPPQKFNF